MQKAIGYVRVSTEGQAAEGVSLSAQREKVEGYAKLYGFELVAVYVDGGASASTLEREGLRSALEELEAGGASALIVSKLDRLTRSVRDLDTLLNRYFSGGRFDLVSVEEQVDTSTATGRMVLNVLMSVSQWEREVIGERTAAALQHKRRRGEYTGGHVPFGYRLGSAGVRLVEDEEEQAILDELRRLQAEGLSLRAIASELNARGVPRRGGRSWHHVAVTRALRGAA